MKSARTKMYQRRAAMLLLLLSVTLSSCDIYDYDGDENASAVPAGGYFYLLERSTVSLIMLDAQLREIKKWALYPVINDSSLQGITFDGESVWISSAGSADKIYQLDLAGDTVSVVRSYDAPPTGQGTVRDIAWAEGSLWALNSGSSTYKSPATLYELNPLTGAILSQIAVPSPEPRALAYIQGYTNVYGSGIEAGLYYTDPELDKIYRYRFDRPYFDTLFSTPQPPRGVSYNFAVGLTFDGSTFWEINSSDVADHLYRINYLGTVLDRYDLPYSEPGPIVWTKTDVRGGVMPSIAALLPNNGAAGRTLDVEIYGTGFKPSTTVQFGADITVNSTSYLSATLLKSNITIAASAPAGKRSVTVTNPGGKVFTLDSAFTISLVTTIPYLWVADQASTQRYLYKIRLTDTTVVQEWSTSDVASDGVQGVGFDGTDIWLSYSGTTKTLYKVDVSGAGLGILSSVSVNQLPGVLRGIVFDNGFMWQAASQTASGAGKIYKINLATGVVVDSVSTPGAEVRGITFANGVLYCNDTSLDSIYAYNPLSGTWSSVFAVPTPAGGTTSNRFSTGLTWDGQSFWIANSTGDFDHIYNVTASGVVVRSFAAPRLGAAQVTGIVFREE